MPTSMIYDLHTHHHPVEAGTAIVQLTPEAFYPQSKHLYSVGLHPWDIRDDWRVQMARLLIMALHPQVVMIGEAGLDKKNGSASMETQAAVFREHVRLSELLRKPLIIHCVKAFDELLALRKELKPTLPWVIHGFRGGPEQWQQLTRAGLRVSLGKHYDAALIGQLPPHHLFIESDDTTELDAIYDHASHDTGISLPELREQVGSNLRQLLSHKA